MHSYENRSRELIHVQAQAAIHGNVETRTIEFKPHAIHSYPD